MNVAICHFRVGKTDGVSLEIGKRKQILESMGHEVLLIAGPGSGGADVIIDELEFDHPQVRAIKENLFSFFPSSDMCWTDLEALIMDCTTRIEAALEQAYQQNPFQSILVHNIFSHGRHLSAAIALYNVIKRHHIKVISTNHDYYWERPEYADLRFCESRKLIEAYLPPDCSLIKHISINSSAAEKLRLKCGIQSTVLPDIFDFEQPVWQLDNYNCDFLQTIDVQPHDLLILQASRISPRKGIELAIQFTSTLNAAKKQLIGKQLYNGKQFRSDSRIVLVLAGYAETECQPYLYKIRQLAAETGIETRFIAQHITAERHSNQHKTYSLWDSYVFADLVTYPSLLEGWGNQFIEAVFARKPILLFEYPVFERDIKPEGYSFLSLGHNVVESEHNGLVAINDDVMENVVKQTISALLKPDLNVMLESNWLLANKFHSFRSMKDYLRKNI